MIHAFTRPMGLDGLGFYFGSYPSKGDAYRALVKECAHDGFTLMADGDLGRLVRVESGLLPITYGEGGLYAKIVRGSHRETEVISERVADAHGSQK